MKKNLPKKAVVAALSAFTLALPHVLFAHGFAGDRFFPPTLTTDDPFATDELAFPTISTVRNPGDDGGPSTRVSTVSFEFDKEILPRLAVGIEEDYDIVAPDGAKTMHGFDNLTLSLKYEAWINAPHEAIFSIGGEWEAGGTGNRQIGRDSTSTFTPTLYFGKGFGDLPDELKYAKPFALTGTLGESLPSSDPDSLEWGLALEYSLPYLESQIKDIGLPAPFKHMIPLVEFTFDTPENRQGGGTTGTINPGVLYENNYFQLGAEALLPVNRASGGVGVLFQVEIYIDDIWPNVFGFPIFGNKP
jgi:hypothetical protein